VIVYTPDISIPQSKRAILFLSNENYTDKYEFNEYDEIVFYRTLRNYQKKEVFQRLQNSSVVWEMDKLGVYKKSYSD